MYCIDGFGYGYYWHFGNSLFILILLVVAAVLVYRLFVNSENRILGRSATAKYFYSVSATNHCTSCNADIEETYLRCPKCSSRLKSNCPSCGKIINTDWVVCPYCETKSK